LGAVRSGGEGQVEVSAAVELTADGRGQGVPDRTELSSERGVAVVQNDGEGASTAVADREDDSEKSSEKCEESGDQVDVEANSVVRFVVFGGLEDIQQVESPNLRQSFFMELAQEFRISKQVGVREGSGPVPIIGVKVGHEVHGRVGEDDRVAEAETAELGNDDGVDSLFQNQVLEWGVETGQFGVVTVLVVVDQKPVLTQRQDSFVEIDDVHLAKVQGGVVVLSVEGGQAGGVRLIVENAVTFAEVHRVDLVTFHQVGELDLHGEATTFQGRRVRDGQYVAVKDRK